MPRFYLIAPLPLVPSIHRAIVVMADSKSNYTRVRDILIGSEPRSFQNWILPPAVSCTIAS